MTTPAGHDPNMQEQVAASAVRMQVIVMHMQVDLDGACTSSCTATAFQKVLKQEAGSKICSVG